MNHSKYLSTSDLALVHAVLDKYRLVDVRNILMFDLLLASGARASELLALRPLDLNPAERSIFIKTLKGGRVREIPLTKSLFSRVQAYASSVIPDEPIFNLSYSRLEQLWRLYSPIAKTLHSLRHTFAIRVLKKTRDIGLVKQALGHKSLVTTMVYVDYVNGIDEMRKILL